MIRRILPQFLRPGALVVTLLATLLVATPTLAVADEVRLQNGDRYTGTIVGLSGGVLTFRTPGGTLIVALRRPRAGMPAPTTTAS
jgi:hypothetical protein